MAVFFTSDLHLGHANIIKYCDRPFLSDADKKRIAEDYRARPGPESVVWHDCVLIDNINKMVSKHDQLWILGDFCFGNYAKARAYLDKIICNDVHLIYGNHDGFGAMVAFHEKEEMLLREFHGQEVFMCHYPMRQWEKSHHGSWHLFGHVHGNLVDIPHLLALDVGVDTHEFRPWSWDEVKQYMEPRIPLHEAYMKTWKDKEFGGMKPGTHG